MKGPAGKMSDDDEVNTGVEGKAEELTRNVVDKFAEAKRHSDLAHAEERARRFNVGERERLYFTELQDYLEEENENEETTKESQEKRKQSLSPSKKFAHFAQNSK